MREGEAWLADGGVGSPADGASKTGGMAGIVTLAAQKRQARGVSTACVDAVRRRCRSSRP